MGSRRYWVVAAVLLLAVGLGAGCGRGQNPQTPGAVPGSTAATTEGKRMIITGEVIEGVEAGCMLLRTDDAKLYLLLGGDRQMILAGVRLEVVGEARPDLVTTCQQGIPFTIAQMRRT